MYLTFQNPCYFMISFSKVISFLAEKRNAIISVYKTGGNFYTHQVISANFLSVLGMEPRPLHLLLPLSYSTNPCWSSLYLGA